MNTIARKTFFCFSCLLTAFTVKNSHIFAGIDFIFLKKTYLTKHERLSIPNFDLSKKIRKVVIKQDKF